jgi:hypothetical protein
MGAVCCSSADRVFDVYYGNGMPFAVGPLENSLLKLFWPGTIMFQVWKEDALVYLKMKQDFYKIKQPAAIPWYDLALYCSMSMECSHLVGTYVAVKAAEGHHAKQRAISNFKRALLQSNYRFSSGLGGFSTMITMCLLSQTDFCGSLVGADKELRRIMFTTTAIYMMEKLEGNESFHDNEVRNTRGSWDHVKGHDIRPSILDTGIVDHYKDWMNLARTYKSSLTISKKADSHLAAAVGLLMEFEGT